MRICTLKECIGQLVITYTYNKAGDILVIKLIYGWLLVFGRALKILGTTVPVSSPTHPLVGLVRFPEHVVSEPWNLSIVRHSSQDECASHNKTSLDLRA